MIVTITDRLNKGAEQDKCDFDLMYKIFCQITSPMVFSLNASNHGIEQLPLRLERMVKDAYHLEKDISYILSFSHVGLRCAMHELNLDGKSVPENVLCSAGWVGSTAWSCCTVSLVRQNPSPLQPGSGYRHLNCRYRSLYSARWG